MKKVSKRTRPRGKKSKSIHDQRERDAERTRARLTRAVLDVLAQEGFGALGINHVARQAGVDKALIYRYFGGLDDLVRAAATSADFWPSEADLLPDLESLRQRPAAEVIATVLKRYARSLHQRPLALEILAWETVRRTEHTAAFESVREETAQRLARLLAETIQHARFDVPAVVALLAGGLNYLSVRRRSIRIFNEVEIAADLGWQRIEDAIDVVCSRLFAE